MTLLMITYHFDSCRSGVQIITDWLIGESASLGQEVVWLACNATALPCSAGPQNQTDSTGQRPSLARMVSADLVRTKGLGLALCSARRSPPPS